MKTLLALGEHPGFEESLRTALNAEKYRVLYRRNIEEAEPLLAHGLVDACVVDLELGQVQGLWVLEKLRRRNPRCPVLVYTSEKKSEWEEEAYLHGVTNVLTKPVRARMLNGLLERLWPSTEQALTVVSQDTTRFLAERERPVPEMSAPPPTVSPSLSVLREFSTILTHSLNSEALLKQFLLLLRELFSINRGAIFIRQPSGTFPDPIPSEGRRLRAAASLGLQSGLLQHFELSFEAGIGAQVLRLGRILRRSSEEARFDPETQKEFELLGAQVAVPLLDRETTLGVAVFDGRVTGEPLVNWELELIFHLLEQVALALKNIWLHDQLSSNHEMMAGILRELSSACVVVNQDLAVLHANKAARKHFARPDRRTGEFEFADLPQPLGAKTYQVLKTGSAVSNFKFEGHGKEIFNISIVPFQRQLAGLPNSVLLIAEDMTQTEQLRQLEVEAANLRLVKAMADRLTHEVGNAMVPLSTHQQLLADKWKDAEFRASLNLAMADGVKRVTRLINQMRFLARDASPNPEAFPLEPLIEEAFEEARKYQPVKTAQFTCEGGGAPIVLTGDRAALKHALAEVLLNALQANPTDPKIGVKMASDSNGNGVHGCHIDVADNGTGFSAEAARKAPAPFFTTRNVGLGLGLTVSRKIIETHHGKLEIVTPKTGQSGLVRITLPVESALGGKSK